MDRHDWFNLLTIVIFALTLFVSFQALDKSSEANKTAVDANNIAYKYYAPSIEPKQILVYDSNIKNLSGEIDIYNSGGRVLNFNPTLHTIANVNYSNYQKYSHIKIYGYYELTGEEMHNTEGLLWKFRIKDGYDRFDKLRSSFNSVASKAYSDASLSLTILLSVNYKDFARKNYSEYYDVSTGEIKNEQEASKILNEANQNYDLAEKFKVSLTFYNLDGETLFKWWLANVRKLN